MDSREKAPRYDENTPVLIVGGSLVGLCTSLFLSWHGVPSLLVERHAGISPHPRAAGFNPRTLETLRTVGVEPTIRQVEPPSFQNSGILKVETLAGKELDWLTQPTPEGEEGRSVSPTRWSIIPQSLMEPILRARAEELGGDLRFHTELVSFEQDDAGVSAVIRDRATAGERTVRARYLVAADGNRSPIRQQLGIGTHGRGTLADQMSIIFHADLNAALRGRHIFLCFVVNPQVQGAIGIAPDGRSGGLVMPYHPEQGEREEEFAGARGVEAVRAAVGIADLPVEIVSVLAWKMAAQVTERLRQNRVFLVGDAAHVMPPTGAFGANTGIADAHNLAWKLALVIREAAGPELLATYDAERRPAAEFTVEQAYARYVERMAPHLAGSDTPASVGTYSVVFGYRYRSAAVLAEGSEENDAPYEDPIHPTGRPGTRAPHIVLERDGERLSTLDLFGRNFVLLTSREGSAWRDAAEQAKERLGIDLEIVTIGSEGDLTDVEDGFSEAYGVTAEGAVLVRPDGFIGWRAKSAGVHPDAALEQALSRLLCRTNES